MQRLRQEASTPAIQSLSPRPESKFSQLRSPRLPIISPTQRLSNKFFNQKSESPVYVKSKTQKREGLEANPGKEEKKTLPPRLITDETGPMRMSGSQSILECSMKESKVTNLKNEVDLLKHKLDTSDRKLKFHQTVLMTLEKSLKIDPSILTTESVYPSIISTEDSSLGDKEQESIQLITETIQNLKNELQRAQDKIKNHEKRVRATEIDKDEYSQVESENVSLKTTVKDLTNKVNKLKLTKSQLKNENIKLKKDFEDNLYKTEAKLTEARLEVKEKNLEADQLKEILHRSENQKKRLADSIKELEMNYNHTRNDLSKTEFQYETLKRKHQTLLETLAIYEEKSKKHELTITQFESQTQYLTSLEQKHKENIILIKTLQTEIEDLKYNFELHRQKWYMKEEDHQKSIRDLLTQVENEKVNTEIQINENLKLKKNLSIKECDESLSGFTREEVSRYLNRLQQAEENATISGIEVKKMKKTMEYYKELVRNKVEIINRLESQAQDNFKVVIKEGQAEEDNLELKDALVLLKAHLMCQSCSIERSVFVVHPCGNFVCKKCKPEQKVCPVCEMKAEICTPCNLIEILDELCQKLQNVLL